MGEHVPHANNVIFAHSVRTNKSLSTPPVRSSEYLSLQMLEAHLSDFMAGVGL